MPVIMPINISPALGFNNGFLGSVVSVLNSDIPDLVSNDELLIHISSETEIKALFRLFW